MPSFPTLRRFSLIFVEQFFWPEGWAGAKIPQKIVVHLAKSYDIDVICGNQPYIKPIPPRSPLPTFPFKIKHLHLPFASHKSIARVINQVFFSLQLVFYICLKKPHLFISQTNPPLSLLPLAIISRLFSVPFVIICMDLYPDVLISSIPGKHLSSLIKMLLHPLFSFVYNSASAIVCIDKTMQTKLCKYISVPSKLKLIYNWSTLSRPTYLLSSLSVSESPLPLPDSNIKLLYSGNIGSSHDISSILSSLPFFSPSDCGLSVLTSWESQNKLRASFPDITSSNQLILTDYQPDDVYSRILLSATFGIVSLKENSLGNVSPSKFQTYLSHGLPVLYIGPSCDISDLIIEYKAGFIVPYGDPQLIYSIILSYLSLSVDKKISLRQNSLALYEKTMSPSVSLEKYSNLVSTLLSQYT